MSECTHSNQYTIEGVCLICANVKWAQMYRDLRVQDDKHIKALAHIILCTSPDTKSTASKARDEAYITASTVLGQPISNLTTAQDDAWYEWRKAATRAMRNELQFLVARHQPPIHASARTIMARVNKVNQAVTSYLNGMTS